MKYYCEDCGEVFDEDEIELRVNGEWLEYWGSRVYREVNTSLCPHCGSESIQEASYCDKCGEAYPPENLDENNLCEDCKEGV